MSGSPGSIFLDEDLEPEMLFCEGKLCHFPIVSDHLHVPDWQPIGVGSLLFFKWTLERVQNIADLKGTNSVPTDGIFRGCEDTVDNFSF